MKITDLLLLTVASFLTVAVACDPLENPREGVQEDKPKELVLSSSTEETDISETVSFTVKYGEDDVTDEAHIFFSSTDDELDSNVFSTDIPGIYEFYAMHDSLRSNTVMIMVKGEVVLTVDKRMIASDGTDMAVFKVIQDSTDVTGESVLYLLPEEGEPVALNGLTFSTTEAGCYSFYAQKGSLPTGRKSIIALTSDPQPENTAFKERAMVTEFTGTWCGNCSLVKASIYDLEDEGWDDAVVVEAHDGDPMATEFVSDLIKDYGAYLMAYPHVTYNMDNQHSSGNYGTMDLCQQYILKNTGQVISDYPCTAGVSVIFEQGDGNELAVNAVFKFTEPGEYRVAAWLLENGIEAVQNNNYSSVVATDYVSVHRNVLRDVSNADEFTGDDINITEDDITEAVTYKFRAWTFDTAGLFNGEPENALVAVFVTKKQANGRYVVNNIVKCRFGETTGFEYVE